MSGSSYILSLVWSSDLKMLLLMLSVASAGDISIDGSTRLFFEFFSATLIELNGLGLEVILGDKSVVVIYRLFLTVFCWCDGAVGRVLLGSVVWNTKSFKWVFRPVFVTRGTAVSFSN